ncbi:hypothetical protein NDU88_004720 [Pleurodeles waltl]|uniref:Uncharacterized protein n=1 Tax=Pleurodeles waltl TaxID=8319 RepID=A0AAV7PDA9_PLEWA|nr:hypothetical protein NDU88_004720 [Pleurodeles waltl]
MVELIPVEDQLTTYLELTLTKVFGGTEGTKEITVSLTVFPARAKMRVHTARGTARAKTRVHTARGTSVSARVFALKTQAP